MGYTYILWHHPYAIVIFTAEIVWLGIALRRGKTNLLLIDTLYWLALGAPLVVLFYGGIMHLGAQHTAIVVLKQALNGMFNALIAWIGLSLLSLISSGPLRSLRRPIPYNHVIFQVAAFFLMLPAIGILLFLTHREVSATQERFLRDLRAEAHYAADSLGDWVSAYANATRVIADLGTTHGLRPSPELQRELKRIHELFPLFYTVFLADGGATNVACNPPTNEKGQSTIGINLKDRFWYKELQETLRPVVSDVFTGKATIFSPIFIIATPVVKDGRLSHYGLGTVNLSEVQRLLHRTGHFGGMACTLTDRRGRVVVSTDASRKPLGPFTPPSTAQAVSQVPDIRLFVPGKKKNISVMASWKGAYFYTTLPVRGTPWTLFAEFPVAPMQSYFYSSAIRSLSVVAAFFAIMIVLATVISRRLSTPILELTTLSKNLPNRIADRERIAWPQSGFLELSVLIDNFRQAAETIEKNLATINDHALRLEETIQERTTELARERQRLAGIITGANVGTWEWNVQTGETLFNERWAAIIGYRLEELAPVSVQTWSELTHPDDLKTATSLLEKHFEGALDYYECELRMRHKDGQWVWISDRGRLISRTPDGKPLWMAGTHTDITGRRQAEEKLHEKTLQLERLTGNLERQVEEEVALRLKGEQILIQQSKLAAMGEMLGAIAHQWRQPLNTLGLILQNIRDAHAYGELDEAVLADAVEKSMTHIQHMSKTIDDFRNFFKPDKKRAPFDAMEAVGEALAFLHPQFSAHGIHYRLTCHTHHRTFDDVAAHHPHCTTMLVSGFRNEFRHVIINLLSNSLDAITAGQAPGQIDVDFYHDGGRIRMTVSDTGGGMAPEVMERAFEPYFTTKPPDKGTGMGLYMSQLIIEHMDGALTVQNGKEGAAFTIELPEEMPHAAEG